MSDTSILPGASAPADSGMAPPLDHGSDEAEGGNRRNLMILGAIAAVVVLAAAAYLLLHKSPSSTDAGVIPRGVPTAAAPDPGSAVSDGTSTGKHHSGAGTKSHGGTTSLPPKTKNLHVRDPFAPLVIPPVATDGNAASTTTVTAASGTDSSSGTTDTTGTTTPVTTPTSGTTTTTGNGNTSATPLWIQLMSVQDGRATFDVGYAKHKFRKFTVQAPTSASTSGTVFDKIFALISIHKGLVTVQIGDATPFPLQRGIAHTI